MTGGKRILFTGGSGFVGRNVIPQLERAGYEVYAPKRSELNLYSPEAVRDYILSHGVEIVFHAANPNSSKNTLDNADTLYQDSMRMFTSVYANRDLVDRVIYLGSGAELDKRRDLSKVAEEAFGSSVPVDPYGQAKYIQLLLARAAANVYDLRLFACFGPWDHWTKFITHCIRSVLANKEITIRQDCRFDYLHVSDFGRVITWSIDAPLMHVDYNIGSGVSYLLSEIAQLVVGLMNADIPVRILSGGLNKEYTPSISRLAEEFDGVKNFMSLSEGVLMQIEHEKQVYPPGGYEMI